MLDIRQSTEELFRPNHLVQNEMCALALVHKFCPQLLEGLENDNGVNNMR
jgi:hypothetical protein